MGIFSRTQSSAQGSSDLRSELEIQKAAADIKHVETAGSGAADVETGVKSFDEEEETRVIVTEEDSKRIVRKTDLHILPFIMWVYFLQSLDKTVIGYAAVFGLKQHAHLQGNDYSNIGSMGYYAQLAAQPLGAYILVKYPVKWVMSIIVFCWGVAMCGMAASSNYHGMLACRFLLGWFEAMCLPLFSLITITWYRRKEQTLRVALWYGQNGTANIIGSALSYGFAQIKSSSLYTYQIIFLFAGLLTVITGPIILFFFDNTPMEARFLSSEDKLKAVERLRANNQGIIATKFNMRHVLEILMEPKSYLWFGIAMLPNIGASVTNVFGPIILQQVVGFKPSIATLMNMPFGALQIIVILGSSYLSFHLPYKGYITMGITIPIIVGSALLYGVAHNSANEGPLLLGYYLLSFIYACNPLIIAWMGGNTAGQTKKTVTYALYNLASSCGNITGPYLFKAQDAPDYLPGLKAVMAIFSAFFVILGLQVLNIMWLNRQKENEREKNGKPRKIKDLSMTKHIDTEEAQKEAHEHLGEQAFLDLTDKQNDEFIYVL